MTTSIEVTAETFIKLGGKLWEKEGKKRVYLNADIFNKLCGTALSDASNKFFFDCESKELMRSYKGKKPQIETQRLALK